MPKLSCMGTVTNKPHLPGTVSQITLLVPQSGSLVSGSCQKRALGLGAGEYMLHVHRMALWQEHQHDNIHSSTWSTLRSLYWPSPAILNTSAASLKHCFVIANVEKITVLNEYLVISGVPILSSQNENKAPLNLKCSHMSYTHYITRQRQRLSFE